MRIEGRIRLGYFPLPLAEAEHIRQHLQLTPRFMALDPCIGEGHALEAITAGVDGHRCGVELDAYRAEEARRRTDQVVQASAFDVHCPAESISLLYLNPPYDFEISEGRNERMERVFLQHAYRWLKPGGILVLVICCASLADCSEILAWNFNDGPSRLYAVPPADPVTLTDRGLPLDEIEDLLAKSPAYRQASRLLIGKEDRVAGRPLTPLHGGHVGLLAVSGLLNGIFGEGPALHIARWQSVKVTDTIEETDDAGVTTIREKERFSHELRVVFRDGRVTVLK